MFKKMNMLTVIISMFFGLCISFAHAEKIEIITPGDKARLCNIPNCDSGAHITRIETGVSLNVLDEKTIKLPYAKINWFKVKYDGKEGWVSAYDVKKVEKTSKRKTQLNAKGLSMFVKNANRNIVDASFPQNGTFWVFVTKYVSAKRVCGYLQAKNYDKGTIVHVLDAYAAQDDKWREIDKYNCNY